jgi:hypothetical protein
MWQSIANPGLMGRANKADRQWMAVYGGRPDRSKTDAEGKRMGRRYAWQAPVLGSVRVRCW